jgi:hypothetical protein
MSEALTLLKREFKPDVALGARERPLYSTNRAFPSYFPDFCVFERFLVRRIAAVLPRGRLRLEREIPCVSAFMAIL